MNYFPLIVFFLFSISLCSTLNIYIDPSSTCTSNCGLQTNPFQTLPMALYIIDQLFESNATTMSAYSAISTGFTNNIAVTFILASNKTHEVSLTNLNQTNPCYPAVDQCVFRFFRHTVAGNPQVAFSGQFATLQLNTQRMVIDSRFLTELSFTNLTIVGNFSNDCPSCTVAPTSNYAFIDGDDLVTDLPLNAPQIVFSNVAVSGFSLLQTSLAYYDAFISGSNSSINISNTTLSNFGITVFDLDFNNSVTVSGLNVNNCNIVNIPLFQFNSSNLIQVNNIQITAINQISSPNNYYSSNLFSLNTSNKLTVNSALYQQIYAFNSIYLLNGSSNTLNVQSNTLQNFAIKIDQSNNHGVFVDSLANNSISISSATIKGYSYLPTVSYSFISCVTSSLSIANSNIETINSTDNNFNIIYQSGTGVSLTLLNINIISNNSVRPNFGNIISLAGTNATLSSAYGTYDISGLYGYYVSSTYYLMNCSSGCSQCTNSSSCVSCTNPFSLLNSTCFDTSVYCGLGSYLDLLNSSCLTCPSKCSSCYDSYDCPTCNTTLNYAFINGNCSQVPNCLSVNATSCVNCANGFYLLNSSTCDVCSNSISDCSVCTNNGSLCGQCQTGYYSSNFSNGTGICKDCSLDISNCASCANGSLCYSCLDGYTLINNTCVACNSIFDNCSRCTPTKCSACSSGFYLSNSSMNSSCTQNNFGLNFPSGIIGQFFHFFSGLCLNMNGNLNLVPCNGLVDPYSLFKIQHLNDSEYSILPVWTPNTPLTVNCSLNASNNSIASFTTGLNQLTTVTSFVGNGTNLTCNNLSSVSCASNADFNNYYANNTCSASYLNETAEWNIEVVNDPSSFGDSKYALMLRNMGISSLCISYSYDSGNSSLLPCNSNSYDFLFGFKVINVSQVENQLTSSIINYSDTISIQWTDTFNTSSNFSFLIYYFNSFVEFQGYTCGSDKANSPVNFTTTYVNSSKIVSVNLTLNDLMTCGCHKTEDSNYMFFDMKAANYDPLSKIILSDYYRLIFLKIAGSNQALYIGYTTDWNITQGSIIDINKTVTYLNVTNALNINISYLISKKYIDKNTTQNIEVTYTTKNRFTISLLNNSLYFVSTSTNKTYTITVPSANVTNGVANQMNISADLGQLPSGYYTFKFYMYFQILNRLLADSNVAIDPSKNFTTSYQFSDNFYVGSNDEISQEMNILEQMNKNTGDTRYLLAIIGVIAGLLGCLILGLFGFYFIRKKKSQNREENIHFPHQPVGVEESCRSPELSDLRENQA